MLLDYTVLKKFYGNFQKNILKVEFPSKTNKKKLIILMASMLLRLIIDTNLTIPLKYYYLNKKNGSFFGISMIKLKFIIISVSTKI